MDIRYTFLAALSAGLLFTSAAALATPPPETPVKLTQYTTDASTQTITIELSNGLMEKIDFGANEVTVSAGGVQSTVSLNAALLEATNNDPQAAAQLYSELIDAMSSGGTINPPSSNPGGGGGGGPIFQPKAVPYAFGGGGACTPAPPLVHCPGEIPTWGTYTFSWKPFGADPFGGDQFGPPSQGPDGCSPGDLDCKIFNDDRRNACDSLTWSGLALLGSEVAFLGGCFPGGVFTAGSSCVAGGLLFTAASGNYYDKKRTCDTPYPGQ